MGKEQKSASKIDRRKRVCLRFKVYFGSAQLANLPTYVRTYVFARLRGDWAIFCLHWRNCVRNHFAKSSPPPYYCEMNARTKNLSQNKIVNKAIETV